MLIRKLFKFESAHILTNCPSLKCKNGLHGHSYKLEVICSSNKLTDYMMVCDFSQISYIVDHFVSAFDHSILIFDADVNQLELKNISKRWISLPFNTTAEGLSVIFFLLIEKAFNLSNLPKDLSLESVIVHETNSGYVKCYKSDSVKYIKFLDKIKFSNNSIKKFKDSKFLEKFINNKTILVPKEL